MKKYILISIAIGSLFLSSCTSKTTPTSPLNNATGSTPVAIQKDSGMSIEKSLSSIPEELKTNERFLQCFTPQVNQCVATVVNESAREKKDVNLCKQLKDENLRNNCERYITTLMARDANNPSLCDKLANNVRECKAEIVRDQAIKSKDVASCIKLKEIYSQSASTTASGVVGPQNTQDSMIYDSCVFQVIQSQDNPNPIDCEKITQDQTKEFCKNSIKNMIEMRKKMEEQQKNTVPPTPTSMPQGPVTTGSGK